MEPVNLLDQSDEEEEAYSEKDREIGIATLALVCLMNSTPEERPHVPSLEAIITECSKPFGKELTKSDVNGAQSRLLLNKDDVKRHIYPLLGNHEETQMREGVRVKVFNEYGTEYAMILKSWNGKSNVLTTGWTAFVRDMGLESGVDYVTLWAFRHRQTEDLCFLIAVTRRSDGGGRKCSGGSSSSSNN